MLPVLEVFSERILTIDQGLNKIKHKVTMSELPFCLHFRLERLYEHMMMIKKMLISFAYW